VDKSSFTQPCALDRKLNDELLRLVPERWEADRAGKDDGAHPNPDPGIRAMHR
jgi:hypothetical protein